MNEIKRRLAKLESNRPQELEDRGLADFTEFWEAEIQWTALCLLRGIEPRHTVDEAGAFWTLDGRLACSPKHMDLGALMGSRREELEAALLPDRWAQFLASNEKAQELLERLLEPSEDAPVPDSFELPMGRAWTETEVDATFGESPHKPFALFLDAEEREATRRLTWTLINNPVAREMLCKITKSRDEFVQDDVMSEGGGGSR